MFTTGLGHEIPAMLAVVTAFFSGLALGAWVLGQRIRNSALPGKWYVAIEGIIGLWAFVSTLLIPIANQFALHWIGPDPSVARHWLVTFAVPFVVLLPATVTMGATLPAMERWLAPACPDRRCVGALYASNTLGAVAGVLVSAWLLVPSWGYRRTVLLLGFINFLCALAAIALARQWRSGRPAARRELSDDIAVRRTALSLTLFFTGLLGIGYEVLGVRALSQVLEGTVYTFAVTLAVFLFATSAGAGLYQWRLRRLRFEPLKSWLLFGLSVVCALGVVTLGLSQRIYETLRASWGDSPVAVGLAEASVAGMVFGLPALLMGVVFAHLTQFSTRRDGGIGLAVALNTLGCALAPIAIGAALLSVLGLRGAFAAVVGGYALLLLPRPGFVGAGVLVALSLFFLPPARLHFITAPPGAKTATSHDGVMASVSVVAYPDGNRSLVVDARFSMGGTGSAIAERRHAQLPLLLHPNPQRALFLGLGTGITFAAAGSHPELEADGVELVPEVIEAMPQFAPFNALPAGRPRLHIHAADARRFIRSSNALYDVIVADLFHPARDGAGALYTREHFQAIRRRLAPGGLFCQWLPLHQLDESMLKVIVRTFLDVFPDADAWLLRFNVDTPVIGLIGRLEPREYAAHWFESRAHDSDLMTQLKSLNLADEFQLFGCRLAGPEALRRFAGDAKINTDDRPLVVFGAPRFYYQRDSNSYGRLLALLELPATDPGLFRVGKESQPSDGFAERLDKFIAARNVHLRGLIAEATGDLNRAIDSYVESARISADFSTGYARCLTIAMQQSRSDLPGARKLLERLVAAQPDRPVARELLERLNHP